jgi:hypothetical protein
LKNFGGGAVAVVNFVGEGAAVRAAIVNKLSTATQTCGYVVNA